MSIHSGQRLWCPLGIALSGWSAISSKGIASCVPNDNFFIDQTHFVTMPVSSHFDLMFSPYCLLYGGRNAFVIIQYRQNNLFHISTAMQFLLDENVSCDVLHTFSSPFDNNFTIFPQKKQLKCDQEVLLSPHREHTRTRSQENKISLFFLWLLQSLIAYWIQDCTQNIWRIRVKVT